VLTTALTAAAAFTGGAAAGEANSGNKPVKMVVLGDSLSAGLGLSAADAFPAKLQKALKDKGINVEMANAGVSGDTASGGRDRLDWSVPEGTRAVIVELGANDALRGADPKQTRAALDAIIRKLKERKIAVLLTGMLAPRNFGPDYVAAFDKIYPELAAVHGVLLYPFLLDGIAGEAALNQPDGIHPNAAGVDALVKGLTPKAEELVLRVKLGMR
jgi:acyl-CoA thioesterase-1